MKVARFVLWASLGIFLSAAIGGCSVASRESAEPIGRAASTVSALKMAQEGHRLLLPPPQGVDEGASACGRAHLISEHGRMTGQSVHLVPVFWDSDVAANTVDNIEEQLEILSVSNLMIMIRSEYGFPGTRPVVDNPLTLELHFNISAVSPVTDANIQAELAWQINNSFPYYFNGPSFTVDPNTSYVFLLHFPPSVTPNYSGTNACSSGGWCAYHGPLPGFDGTKITYAVIPDYSTGPCANQSHWCVQGGVPTSFAEMTVVESHEIAESLTDPAGAGFKARSPKDLGCELLAPEIGDICESTAAVNLGSEFGLPAMYAQTLWSNKANSCVGSVAALNDFDGDGRSDLVLTGGRGWATMPVAFSNGNGTYSGTNNGETSGDTGFASDAQAAGARPVSGDFNGDGVADIALIAESAWNTIPLALSNGRSGTYTGKNASDGGFSQFTSPASGARPISGDFDGDGLADIAMVGGVGWNTIPVATANPDGTFTVTNGSDGGFGTVASHSWVKTVSGDFDCDGLADIAAVGDPHWNTIPIAHSNANGTFTMSNASDGGFAAYASASGAEAVAGDFDGDCFADIAIVGVAGGTIPVAFNNHDGSFTVRDLGVTAGDTGFTSYAATAGAKPVAGDFDGDGLSDIALTGAAGWSTMPFARSNGDGTFYGYNSGETSGDTYFAVDATGAGVLPVSP